VSIINQQDSFAQILGAVVCEMNLYRLCMLYLVDMVTSVIHHSDAGYRKITDSIVSFRLSILFVNEIIWLHYGVCLVLWSFKVTLLTDITCAS
jgi:hypothetical protein